QESKSKVGLGSLFLRVAITALNHRSPVATYYCTLRNAS
ncbi:unnamed protein product, partial [Rhizoctonia solani]